MGTRLGKKDQQEGQTANVDRWPVRNWVFSCPKSGKKAAGAAMKTNKDESERQVNAGSEKGRGEQAQHMPVIDEEQERRKR